MHAGVKVYAYCCLIIHSPAILWTDRPTTPSAGSEEYTNARPSFLLLLLFFLVLLETDVTKSPIRLGTFPNPRTSLQSTSTMRAHIHVDVLFVLFFSCAPPSAASPVRTQTRGSQLAHPIQSISGSQHHSRQIQTQLPGQPAKGPSAPPRTHPIQSPRHHFRSPRPA